MRVQSPSRVLVAVEVAPLELVKSLRSEVDEVICTLTPDRPISIRYWYMYFPQTSDQEVIDLLQRAWRKDEVPTPGAQEHSDLF